MSEAIDKKFLAGLTFKSSKPVKTEEGTKHQATERALRPDDVISWREDEKNVYLVAGDGRKYTVNKTKAGKEDKSETK